MDLAGHRISILSRCSWTLYNFRRTLVKAIESRGAEVVALGGGGDGYEAKLAGEGVRFEAIPVSRRGINPLVDLWLFVALLLRFWTGRAELVHAFTIKPVIYGIPAAALAGVPVRVATITGLGHAFTTGAWPVRVLAKWLYKLSLRFADVVFFQNRDDRELFLANGLVAQRKVRMVAGSGVDLSRFTRRPLPSSASGVPTFLMISRLIKEKGVREYVRAAEVVKQKVPAVRCLLLGGLDARNPSGLSAREIELLGDSAVEWFDEVADVRPFIEQADVLVLPSYREGLPKALLEGAAMGRALLATDVPGCRDVVIDGQSGYLVPAQNADALATAMLKFASDVPGIAPMGDRAREFVAAHFDETAIIKQTLATYEELLRLKVER